MKDLIFAGDSLRIVVGECQDTDQATYFIEVIELRTPDGWEPVLSGIEKQEFSTSFGAYPADRIEASTDENGNQQLRLFYRGDKWEAVGCVTLSGKEPVIRREQTYRFLTACTGAVHPGWAVNYDDTHRYTFPLRVHEKPFTGLPPLRADVSWALPFPFHVWNNRKWVGIYGVARNQSPGTLDYTPSDRQGVSFLRTYYPDTTDQDAWFYKDPQVPQTHTFAEGDTLTITEAISFKMLSPWEEPLLEAEKMAARILLEDPPPDVALETVSDGIAGFYEHCELWEPHAFGNNRGWFLNMWTYTQTGEPKKYGGESHGFFDFGWGEGIAAEIIHGIARYWQRTGENRLLPYVDEMTGNMHLFKRSNEPDAPYYDRSDGERFGDFGLRPLVWTHSLGHTGNQLLLTYLHTPSYPDQKIRERWLDISKEIGAFFAGRQNRDGDLPDIFDIYNQEANHKSHRIAARAVVCGLWTRLAKVTGNADYIDRALALAKACAPEIHRYEYYNQMIDALDGPMELIDGEAAYYALEGLAPLYAETKDSDVLALCRKAAAFGICWTYFFNLPDAYKGVARGGQVCRMPDFPLLYPIGPAKAIEPLLTLYNATGDLFYEKIAHEMVSFIGKYQIHKPGKPWHGAIIHAIEQYSGRHWGPEKAGQVDTGMATGNSFAAIEIWLAHLQGRQ